MTLDPIQIRHLHHPLPLNHQVITQMPLHHPRKVPGLVGLLILSSEIHRETGLFTSLISWKINPNLCLIFVFSLSRPQEDDETTNDFESEKESGKKRRRTKDSSNLKDVSENIGPETCFK